MGHILGYGEILLEDNEQTLSPAQAEDLHQIIHAGERLLNVIDDYIGANKSSLDEIDLPAAQYALRTQLTHLSGYCEMLEEVFEDDDRHELIPDVKNISSAIGNLLLQIGLQLTPEYFTNPDAQLASAGQSQTIPSEGGIALGAVQPEVQGNLLIVDDSQANRDLLQRRISKMGYQAFVAGSGDELFAVLDQQQIELILLDMVMPDRDGLDILQELKTTDRFKHIPVIMLSALDENKKVIASIVGGAEDYILKPPNPVLRVSSGRFDALMSG